MIRPFVVLGLTAWMSSSGVLAAQAKKESCETKQSTGWTLPAEKLSFSRTEKWLKPGKAAGQGRDIAGRVKEFRLGDLDKSWFGEIKGNLKLQSRSVFTRVRSETLNYHLVLPWQPFKHHEIRAHYRALRVRTDYFTRNNITFGLLPVKGAEYAFGDRWRFRRNMTAEFWMGGGNIHITPPGRNKMNYSWQRLTFSKPMSDQLNATATLQRSDTSFVGQQWTAKGVLTWRHPRLKWFRADLGADFYNDGIPVHENDLGPMTSQLAFIYKSDRVDLGPRVAPVYENRIGMLWFNIGADYRF